MACAATGARGWPTATAIVLPMILVGLIAWRRSLAGLVAVAAYLAGWLALNMALFAHGICFSLAVPLAAAVPPLALFGAVELWLDRRRAVFFADRSALLSQFQAPGLGDYLTRHPDFLATPVRLEAAVLFIDLSGFTGVSEVLGANQVRELLNTFQSLVAEEVVACGGVITGFAGDGAMILFGLPNPAADDARRAARCAMLLTARTRAGHRRRRPRRRRGSVFSSAPISARRWLRGWAVPWAPAHHRDRRHRQCGQPADGGGGDPVGGTWS